MSNITQVKFVKQPLTFPGSPVSVPADLQTAAMNTWTAIENGGPVNAQGQTIFQLVQSAIQAQVQKTQQASSVLNSLTFGPQNQIGYFGKFTPPPANAGETGGAGTIEIALAVEGNNLAFTVNAKSNPTFEVSFDLTITITLTLPVSLGPNWAVGINVSARVEALNVTTHNVGVYLCDQNAVTQVLDAINGQIVPVPGLHPAVLTAFDSLVEGVAAGGWTQLVEQDDGAGTLVLTALGPDLTVNGRAGDSIVLAGTAAGLEITAQGQSGTFVGPIKSITVNPAGGANSIKIEGAPSGATISVENTQHGTNTVTVGSDLSKLAGTTIDVSDTSGSTALIVDDSADTTARVAAITKTAVAFTGLTTVSYSGNITSLKVLGGGNSDQLFIASTGPATTVDPGPGVNSVYVGLSGTKAALAGEGQGSVQPLTGPLDVPNSQGETNLVIDASGDNYAGYQVSADEVAFTQGPAIQFQAGFQDFIGQHIPPVSLTRGVISLTVYGRNSAGNNVQVEGVGPETKVTLWGTGSDVIGGPAAASVTHDVYLTLKPIGPLAQEVAAGH